MKNIATYLLTFSFLAISLISCNNDEFPYTGENGRPSMAQYGDEKIYFYYDGNRISRIRTNNSFVSDFKYTDNILSQIFTYPIDKNIADGSGSTYFSREGNKIVAKSSGEPSFEIYVKEIEVDENDIPVKITDGGIFVNRTGEPELEKEGEFYSLLSFESETKRLLKEEIYRIATAEKVATYTFEYEDTPGIMSQVNLPLWFYTYRNHWSYGIVNNYHSLYFNHSGNLIKKTIEDDLNSRYTSVEYRYKYNKDGFPVRLSNVSVNGDNPDITIRY